VDRIVVMHSNRSVVRWAGDRAAGHIGRLRAVARQAVMQSRQLWLPEVVGPEDFTSVARWPGAALAGPEGEPPSLDRPVTLIGPEGGWSDAEASVGLPLVSFGPSVLRAETAAVAAAAVLCAMRAGLCRPV
jgi:16S rRNA (uracil1498-N3)-methyltransferase